MKTFLDRCIKAMIFIIVGFFISIAIFLYWVHKHPQPVFTFTIQIEKYFNGDTSLHYDVDKLRLIEQRDLTPSLSHFVFEVKE